MFQLRTAIAQIKEHSTLGVQSDIRALCLWLVMETGRKSSDFWNWLDSEVQEGSAERLLIP
jgi:hypothetical protein